MKHTIQNNFGQVYFVSSFLFFFLLLFDIMWKVMFSFCYTLGSFETHEGFFSLLFSFSFFFFLTGACEECLFPLMLEKTNFHIQIHQKWKKTLLWVKGTSVRNDCFCCVIFLAGQRFSYVFLKRCSLRKMHFKPRNLP